MKTLIATIALAAGIAIGANAKGFSRLLLTRNPPETPSDYAPRFRSWKNGVEVFD